MASMSNALLSSSFDLCSHFSSSSSHSRPLLSFLCNSTPSRNGSFSGYSSCINSSFLKSTHIPSKKSHMKPLSISSSFKKHICRAAEYKFPDPIPEFADAEIEKFKNHLLKKLSKKELYGDSVEEIVGICTEIFSTFMHNEYGGPGTLMVLPFVDMADTLTERELPGGPQAARAAVKWAQAHVDKDWNEWNGSD